MNIEGVKEGYVRLSSPNGIVDNINIKLSADGTITEGNSAQ